MNKELNNKLAGNFLPESGTFSGEWLDSEIGKALGKNIEPQDGIIKSWSKSVQPDETNWQPLPRFSEGHYNISAVFEENGIAFELQNTEQGVFASFRAHDCSWDTPVVETKAMALSIALLSLLSNNVIKPFAI